MILLLALLDAAAGIYLVQYARHREQRDKDGVLAVGYVLLLCAVLLLVIELLPLEDRPSRVGGPRDAGPSK